MTNGDVLFIFDVQFTQKQFELKEDGENALLPKIQSAKV